MCRYINFLLQKWKLDFFFLHRKPVSRHRDYELPTTHFIFGHSWLAIRLVTLLMRLQVVFLFRNSLVVEQTNLRLFIDDFDLLLCYSRWLSLGSEKSWRLSNWNISIHEPITSSIFSNFSYTLGDSEGAGTKWSQNWAEICTRLKLFFFWTHFWIFWGEGVWGEEGVVV